MKQTETYQKAASALGLKVMLNLGHNVIIIQWKADGWKFQCGNNKAKLDSSHVSNLRQI